jgi:hypothetical protein
MNSNPENPVDALYREGLAAWEAGRHADAAAHARAAIALEPGLPALHFLLGSALMPQGFWPEAITAFGDALALNIGYPMSHHCALQSALARARIDMARGVVPQMKALPAAPPIVSCIICSITPARFTKISANLERLLADVPHEIIGIHDARSLCEGYNRGARQSRGDILLFCHDDIEIVGADFAARLLAHLKNHELVGVAGSTRLAGNTWIYTNWRHVHGQIGMPGPGAGQITVTAFQMQGCATGGAQMVDGVLMAARRELWHEHPFDQDTFDGWHLYDFDFSFSAYRAGRSVAIAHDLLVVHESTGDFGPAWQAYAQKFIAKHGIALATPATASPPELCSVTVGSVPEWMRFATHLANTPAA